MEKPELTDHCETSLIHVSFQAAQHTTTGSTSLTNKFHDTNTNSQEMYITCDAVPVVGKLPTEQSSDHDPMIPLCRMIGLCS
jgi:hypothetical protein